jgi:hypothetical protein
LLKKHGGLWVDATTYCTRPLDGWLETYIEQGFFAFSFNHTAERMVASWFLYGEKNNLIINKWHEAAIQYCQTKQVIGTRNPCNTLEKWQSGEVENHYFWFHYIFGDLYRSDIEFKKAWDTVPKLSEKEPHFIQDHGMLKKLTVEAKKHIDLKKAPLYKLNYRFNEADYSNQSNLYYLLQTKPSQINIASTIYDVKDSIPNVRFIHIGKCGGTALLTAFKDQHVKLHNCHLVKPDFNPVHQYIIWIRNPLHRFSSAFNYSYALVNLDTSNLDINNLTIDNCLAPGWVRQKMENSLTYIYSTEYDELINYFETPNNLAESLTHTNSLIKEKALRLMNHPFEHLNKGIGWYLNNGEFVAEHNEQILFVGKVESMKTDIDKLSTILGIPLSSGNKKVRQNKTSGSSYLSPLAINNILDFYKRTDYKALKEMLKKGWIDDKTYQSYFVNFVEPS